MSRWREPYQATRKAYEQVSGLAVTSTEAAEKGRTWTRRRPDLESQVDGHMTDLWDRFLEGGPRQLTYPWKRIDPRLLQLRSEQIGAYRKKLKKFRDLPRSSWPAQIYHFKILVLRIRLLLTRPVVFALILGAIVLWLELYYPAWADDLVRFFDPTGLGP